MADWLEECKTMRTPRLRTAAQHTDVHISLEGRVINEASHMEVSEAAAEDQS